MGNGECNLHHGTMKEDLSACYLVYHARFRRATHIWTTFLDITKDSISDTNASATRAEAALYDFAVLFRMRLGEVVQPLIVFFRHCRHIDREQGDVDRQKVKPTEVRTSLNCGANTSPTGEPFEPYVVAIGVALGPSHTCLIFNLRTYVTINLSCSGGV